MANLTPGCRAFLPATGASMATIYGSGDVAEAGGGAYKGVSRGGGRRRGEERRSVAKGKELKPSWAWALSWARERGKISRVLNVLERPTVATSCFLAWIFSVAYGFCGCRKRWAHLPDYVRRGFDPVGPARMCILILASSKTRTPSISKNKVFLFYVFFFDKNYSKYIKIIDIKLASSFSIWI